LSTVPFIRIKGCDLDVGSVYEGGNSGNVRDDPLSLLLPGVGNQGGFRISGRPRTEPKFVALYSSGEDNNWPDRIDYPSNKLIYFGDNKRPGNPITQTALGGNALLESVFSYLHESPRRLGRIPPFFAFRKSVTPASSRSVEFLGLAVPGAAGLPAAHDLLVVSQTIGTQQCLNYLATFTILQVPTIRRTWLDALAKNGRLALKCAPKEWVSWIRNLNYG